MIDDLPIVGNDGYLTSIGAYINPSITHSSLWFNTLTPSPWPSPQRGEGKSSLSLRERVGVRVQHAEALISIKYNMLENCYICQ
jgi:hypothetical protein